MSRHCYPFLSRTHRLEHLFLLVDTGKLEAGL